MIELIQGDCMDYMKTCKDNEFDLAIVDPPYGIGENGDKAKGRNRFNSTNYKSFAGGDTDAPKIEYFNELKRVSKNQIIWGANHFIERIPAASSPSWVVWDKQNGKSDFADCELAYTSFKTAVRMYTFQWAGMLQGDMKNKEQRIHPTQKPAKLYQWLLTKYAKSTDRILDTHLGSASSAIAAHYFGCEFVGIELDKDYYTAAKERFNLATKQNTFEF
jgi:site-specific DNA-methyltransferase (adenine-specific)